MVGWDVRRFRPFPPGAATQPRTDRAARQCLPPGRVPHRMSGPPLNSLEVLGLLSARLIHALSNQLVIITGNVCAAAKTRGGSAESAAALHSALTAANGMGNLLNEFADLRRDSADALGEI